MAICDNCISRVNESDCELKPNNTYCEKYSPVRVTNKERIGIRSYMETTLMLSDLFLNVRDSDTLNEDIYNWLQSN